MARADAFAAMAADLSDEELQHLLQCEERCALLGFRIRRHLAVERVCCLKREAEKRRRALSSLNNVTATGKRLPFRKFPEASNGI